MGPDALDTLNPLPTDSILPQAPVSERHSVIDPDPRAPSPLPPPNPSFMPQRDSVASSLLTAAGRIKNSPSPLDPSTGEAVYLQDNGGHLLPLPNPSLMIQRESVASSFLVPVESVANNSSHQANSLSPIDPSKGEAASLHGNGEDPDSQNFAETTVKRTHRLRLLLILAGIFIVIAVIVLGTHFGITRKSSKASAGPSGQNPATPSASASAPSGNPKSNIVYGGDGTLVTTEQGTTFTYNNSFGGYFVVDSGDPFNNNARAQSRSPPLNQSWQFGTDQILG